jgi:hypothetical protein
MPLLDLDVLREAPLTRNPFSFTVVPGFVPAGPAAEVIADFPAITHAGLLPLGATRFGPRFRDLIEEIRSEPVARAFSEKFDMDLMGRPLMINVRGRCQEKDGRIHTDSAAKLVTALLYFNESWEAEGGRLRLLRGLIDLDDAIAEVVPAAGTLVAFRRSERSFHGHKSFSGVRRYVMFNWMASTLAARRELARHRLSAHWKRWVQPEGPSA